MITIPTASLVMLAGGLFAAAVFVIGLLAYWKGRIYRAEAEALKKEAERDKKSAIDERNKADLILEEAKRHGYRPERRVASGKWGRLGYSDGPVGPERAGPDTFIGTGPGGMTGYTGVHGQSGPTGPSGHGRTESEVLKEILEFQRAETQQRKRMEDAMVALFKEVMTRKD